MYRICIERSARLKLARVVMDSCQPTVVHVVGKLFIEPDVCLDRALMITVTLGFDIDFLALSFCRSNKEVPVLFTAFYSSVVFTALSRAQCTFVSIDMLFGIRSIWYSREYQISHFHVFAGIRTPKKTLFWPLGEPGLSPNPFLKILIVNYLKCKSNE